MQPSQIICLGLGVTCAAGLVFLLTWVILAYIKHRTFIGVERMWFRCVTAAFYLGLTIVLCGAVASLIQDVVKVVEGIA